MSTVSSRKAAVPHPIPYQGSKRHLCDTILACFPTDITRLVEPFAGSAAVSLATAHHMNGTGFLLNDSNVPLMQLWELIVNAPDQLIGAYTELWLAQRGRERVYYDLVREEFNRTHRPDYLLYLLARCVKASVRYNPKGEFNQSPDNRRRGADPTRMADRIRGASALLRGRVMLTHQDYRNTLDTVAPMDLVYMDPPYQGVSDGKDRRYAGEFSHQEFWRTLEELNQRGIYYVLSYDGRSSAKTYGQPLPQTLEMVRIEIDAGRSSQATLLDREDQTFESLYISPALSLRLGPVPTSVKAKSQMSFAETE